jgi:hypothetical protein
MGIAWKKERYLNYKNYIKRLIQFDLMINSNLIACPNYLAVLLLI